MANHSPFFKANCIAAAVALCITSTAWAQQTPTEITITDKLPSQVSGFGDVSARELPFSTTTINQSTLQDIGARRVSDALHLDASVTDSYNSPAYWDILSVRGFTLDNRYNYRREGLPISAETMIPMDNKERIELLKGTSGIQAGASAPGGLVNYVVKRAPISVEQQIRNISMSYGEGNNRLVAADLGGRFGGIAEFGYRFNVAHEDLNPYIKDTTGHRDLVALALDWRLKPGTVFDFEFEQSHREQIGVNGYSLLGTTLPSPVDPRNNLTRQPWTLPGVFDASTSSIRLRQTLENDWLWTTQVGRQRLKTDDRLTYGFGYNCYGAEKICDRFTSAGDYEIDDYRSENERRIVDAVQTKLGGSAKIWNLDHHLSFEILRQRQLDKFPPNQAWNFAGYGNVLSGTSSSIADPSLLTANTNRSEYSTELSLKDHIELSPTISLWTGLRHVTFNKTSSQNSPTYGTNPSALQGHINLPWVGISKRLNETMIFASHGHGLEQNVAPNNSTLYTNAGEILGVSRSRQSELGIRNADLTNTNWSATYFEISRPLVHDTLDTTPQYPISTRYLDGTQTHKGIELSGDTSVQRLKLSSSARWMQTSISGVEVQPETVGTVPLNVPKFVLRGMAEYRYASVPGLRTGLRITHEGERNITEDGNTKLPAWTTLGASAHYDTKVNNVASTWTFAVDNLADKRYWRESPKQFGHYYLYPGAPRTLRASVQFRL